MALASTVVFDVRTTGSDTNGGGFNTSASGTDWSQQNSPQYSVTDGVANGTTTITSATANFGSDVVGNVVYIAGGTGSITAGWYEVKTRSSATTITVDRSTGLTAGTGVTLHLGGALLSPAVAMAAAGSTAQTVYIKSGSYAITSASTNVAGGCLSVGFGSGLVEGYGSVHGDRGATPTLSASGISGATLLTVAGSTTTISNLSFDGNSLSTLSGVLGGTRTTCLNISVANCTVNGMSLVSGIAVRCSTSGCSGTAAFNSTGAATFIACVANSNTSPGFRLVAGAACVRCLSLNNAGATVDGFLLTANSSGPLSNCTSYGNGRDGVRINGAGCVVINMIAESNGGFGFNNSLPSAGVYTLTCAAYNNTSGASASTTDIGFVQPTSSMFVDAAGGDFAPNSTSSGGAVIRGAGLLASGFLGLPTTTSYTDIGAVQHQDAGGGSGALMLNPALDGM